MKIKSKRRSATQRNRTDSPRASNQKSAHLLHSSSPDPRKVTCRLGEVLEDRLDALTVRGEDEHLAREGIKILAEFARVPALCFCLFELYAAYKKIVSKTPRQSAEQTPRFVTMKYLHKKSLALFTRRNRVEHRSLRLRVAGVCAGVELRAQELNEPERRWLLGVF